MLPAFRRAAQGILNQMGEDAFFNGATTPIKINIERGVQVEGFQNDTDRDIFMLRDVATISSEVNPKAGDRFVQNGRTYRLEYRAHDSGVLQRFVVMDVTT